MKQNVYDYLPQSADLSEVVLPESLNELTESIARNVHEVWAKGRMDEGWTYGAERDEVKKKHPCLILTRRGLAGNGERL